MQQDHPCAAPQVLPLLRLRLGCDEGGMLPEVDDLEELCATCECVSGGWQPRPGGPPGQPTLLYLWVGGRWVDGDGWVTTLPPIGGQQ